MKYPAIIRNDNEVEMLLLNEDSAIILSEAHKGQVHDVSPRFRRRYVDITHEYLSNTWGVVESKEHAEFIIELAELHGFDVGIEPNKAMCFEFSVDSVSFYGIPSEVFAHNEESREITIPLPPKAKTEKPDLLSLTKPELPKHIDFDCNKCGGKCCAGFCDDWNIGDDALMMSGKCKVVALADKHGNLAVTNEFGFNLIVNKSEVKKPKSKQDLLIEDLQTKLCNNNAVDNYILACDIINGDIDGLSYGSVDNAKLKLSAMINCRYTGLTTPTDMGREIKRIADEAADFILSKYNITAK